MWSDRYAGSGLQQYGRTAYHARPADLQLRSPINRCGRITDCSGGYADGGR